MSTKKKEAIIWICIAMPVTGYAFYLDWRAAGICIAVQAIGRALFNRWTGGTHG